MTHAVVQYKKETEVLWSIAKKVYFSGDGSAAENSHNWITLGNLTVILKHYLRPHIVRVVQAVPSDVKLREDDRPIAELKPDGGNQTIFEYKDGTGTTWHVYHAGEKLFRQKRARVKR